MHINVSVQMKRAKPGNSPASSGFNGNDVMGSFLLQGG
jgi:hypothetical protein